MDLAVIAILLLFTILGLLSGMLLQVLRLGATVASVLLALRFTGPSMEAWPSLLDSQPLVRDFLFPVAIFSLSYLVLSLAARLVVTLFHKTSPTASISDRLLGGLFGLLKGALVSYFIVAIMLSVEDTASRPLPYLDLSSSLAAKVVRAYPIGRVRDWDHWPQVREWFQRVSKKEGQGEPTLKGSEKAR